MRLGRLICGCMCRGCGWWLGQLVVCWRRLCASSYVAEIGQSVDEEFVDGVYFGSGFLTRRRSDAAENFPSRRCAAARDILGGVLSVAGIALLVAGGFGLIPQAAGFFGGGVVLLVAAVTFISRWLKRPVDHTFTAPGWWTIARLGFRNATYRPGRTVLCITLIASAAFIVVAVDSFRRSGVSAADRKVRHGWLPAARRVVATRGPRFQTPQTAAKSLNLTIPRSSIERSQLRESPRPTGRRYRVVLNLLPAT
jgi:hypothetical protein